MKKMKKKISKGCPQYYRSLSKRNISEGGPTFYRSLSNEPSRKLKQKPFVLEIIFIHGKNPSVKESVRTRGMGHGIWH